MIMSLYVPLGKMNCATVRNDGKKRWVTTPKEGGDVMGLEV
jgi:hypothetical protein